MIFIQQYKADSFWVSVLFPAVGRTLWAVAVCFLIVMGSTEFRHGLKQNQHLLCNVFAQIAFRLLRHRLENSQRKGSSSILENDILGVPAQPADSLTCHDVLREFLSSRLLHNCYSHYRFPFHDLCCCLRIHDPFRKSNNYVYKKICRIKFKSREIPMTHWKIFPVPLYTKRRPWFA